MVKDLLLILIITIPVGAGLLALATALSAVKVNDRPVEGVDGLDASLGRDVQRGGGLYRSRAGAGYTGSHRRKGPSRWLAHLGRTHREWIPKKVRDLP